MSGQSINIENKLTTRRGNSVVFKICSVLAVLISLISIMLNIIYTERMKSQRLHGRSEEIDQIDVLEKEIEKLKVDMVTMKRMIENIDKTVIKEEHYEINRDEVQLKFATTVLAGSDWANMLEKIKNEVTVACHAL